MSGACGCPERSSRPSPNFGSRNSNIAEERRISAKPFRPPQRGQQKPSGQRSRNRYSRQASSVEKRASNSIRSRGKSSIGGHTTGCGYRSQVNTHLRKFSTSKAYRELNASLAQGHLKPDLLFGLRSAQGETDLLHLYDSKLHQVREYIAVGAGHSTAMFFSKWLYRPEFDIEAFAPLAVQVFRAAKGTHVGCEGNTTLHRLFNRIDGIRSVFAVQPMGDEKLLWGLHDMLPSLLFCCADDRL